MPHVTLGVLGGEEVGAQSPNPSSAPAGPVLHFCVKSGPTESCRWDLNPGPRPYQGRALPTEPRQRCCVRDSRKPGSSISSRPSSVGPATRAGDGNRTHVACLEGRYSTIELHPPGRVRPHVFRRGLAMTGFGLARGRGCRVRGVVRVPSSGGGGLLGSIAPPVVATTRAGWVEQDSNLRRHCHQIYSLAPLTTWVSTRVGLPLASGPGPRRRAPRRRPTRRPGTCESWR